MINDIIWLLIKIFNYFVLAFFVGFNSFYLLTSLLAFRALRKYSKRLKSVSTDELLSSSGLPPITLIAPAFNEEATCVESAKSLLTLNYPDYEVLVINDGSTDHTLEQLTEAFDLIPLSRLPMAEIKTAEIRGVYRSKRFHRLWVIDKVNGGKSDAINVGINYCRDPLFCVLDADSLLERNALIRIVRPFLEDQKTVATGGIIRIINGCTVRSGSVEKVELPDKLLPRFQVLEYLRAFLFGRMGWDAVNATLIISGAFGIFKRSIVVQVGGYSTDTVGEDMELIVRIHRHCRENKIPYRINFIPDPVAGTEWPETLRVLGRQRDRWQRGLWD
ncbi:glycosyltransferase family 2 protein, partial [bacterium]|nr:glycosyltransferase family 2 protein [bacterium]